MTISKRLMLMISIALAGLLLVGGVGVFQFKRMNGLVSAMTDRSIPSLIAINDVGEAYRDMRTLLLSYMMESDADLRSGFKGKLDEASKHGRTAIEHYVSLTAREDEKPKVTALKNAFDKYLAAFNNTISKTDTGSADLAQAAMYGEVMPAAAEIEKQLKANQDEKLAAQHGSAADLNAAYKSSIIVMGVVIVAGAGLMLFFGIQLNRSISGPLATMNRTVVSIGASLDFTQRVPINSNDEIGMTVATFNRLLDTLQSSFGQIAQGIRGVSASANAIDGSAQHMQDSIHTTSESASSMAAAVEQVTVMVNHVADRAADTESLAIKSGKIADDGAHIIETTVKNIDEIASSVRDAAGIIGALQQESSKITVMVTVIKEVADQTNLLALNAAIEAARAGEQGRGFAVVADEVRKLAERTSQSTQEISKLVASISGASQQAVVSMKQAVDSVEIGVVKAKEAGGAISEIRNGSRTLVDLVADISHAIREQSAASASMATQVERVAEMSEAASAEATQTTNSVSELRHLSNQMQDVVSRFKV